MFVFEFEINRMPRHGLEAGRRHQRRGLGDADESLGSLSDIFDGDQGVRRRSGWFVGSYS